MDVSQQVVELVDDHPAQIVLDQTGGVRPREPTTCWTKTAGRRRESSRRRRPAGGPCRNRVAKDDRLRGAPAEIGELPQRDEIDLGRERRAPPKAIPIRPASSGRLFVPRYAGRDQTCRAPARRGRRPPPDSRARSVVTRTRTRPRPAGLAEDDLVRALVRVLDHVDEGHAALPPRALGTTRS